MALMPRVCGAAVLELICTGHPEQLQWQGGIGVVVETAECCNGCDGCAEGGRHVGWPSPPAGSGGALPLHHRRQCARATALFFY